MARPPAVPELPLGDAMRVRSAGITTVGLAVRIALATTVSYFLARQISHSELVLFAPVTTLLVVQASPFATVGASLQRTFGTGVGVLLATLYVQLVPINALTFGIAILIALLVARLLPVSLPTQLQIPVAVVFVLALGAASLEQDLWRVLDVAIGGAVGILVVYAWPGKPDLTKARTAVDTFVESIPAQLRRIGREVGTLDAVLPEERKHAFTGSSRALRRIAVAARDEYDAALNAVRFHPRARGATEDLDRLGRRLAWISGIAIQVRALSGAADRLYDRPGLEPALSPSVLHLLLDELADLVERADAAAPEVQARGAQLRERIAYAIDEIAGDRVPVAEVLQSVSLIGRLDLLIDSVLRGVRAAGDTDDDGDAEGDDEAADR